MRTGRFQIFLAIALCAASFAASVAFAAEPQIRSIAADGEAWIVRLEDARKPGFQAEGEALAAEALGKIDGVDAWRVSTPPPDAERLLVTRKGKPVIGMRVGSLTPEAAPFNDWIVYHIMMAYFRNANPGNDRKGMRRWVHTNYAGGDLQGVLQKVDYIAGLGANAVWLSPVFATETSHGYDVLNYYQVGEGLAVPGEPDASLELFREVVRALQSRGVRVILDLPLDYGSGAYDLKNGDPHELRPRHTGPRQEAEKVWASWGTDFRYWNFGDEDTREFLIKAALHWLQEENIDGYRLDYVRGVPHDFWAEHYAAIKAVRPEAFLFGEAWQDGHSERANAVDIALYYEPVPGVGRQFDSLIDFPMQMAMTDVFARGRAALKLEKWLQQTAALYGEGARPLTFLDNHDLSRFLSWAQDNEDDRLVAALTFMSALSGPMAIFYGTETGIEAGRPTRGFIDAGRVAMPWGSLNEPLVQRVSAVLGGRRDHPALTHGGRVLLMSDDDSLVMMKVHPDETVLVGVNVAKKATAVSFAPGSWLSADVSFAPLLDAPAPEVDADGKLQWTLPPISTSLVSVIVSADEQADSAQAPQSAALLEQHQGDLELGFRE